MAAALLEHHSMGRIEVRSAGSAPADQINPVAVQAIAEWGIEISGLAPKKLDPNVVERSDVVITMGCGDACPIIPGAQILEWSIPDPKLFELKKFNKVRDMIKEKIESDLL